MTTTDDVQQQHQAERRDHGPDHGERAGPVAVARPQIQHDCNGCDVLDQQCDAHVEVSDREEVEELRACDGEDAVGDHRAPCGAQHVPSPPHGEDARAHQHQRSR